VKRLALAGLGLLCLQLDAGAQARRPTSPTPPAPVAAAPVPDAPPPYEPQLLRLAEILGALTHLTDVCGSKDAAQWRTKMQALLDTEGDKNRLEKERLAGAYNRGFRGYALSYRSCTPNAEAIIGRFLSEGGRIADEVVNRFGAS
jgi:uncharacterized protein (TIGR02301 family)